MVITVDKETITKHLIVSGFHQPGGELRKDKLGINLNKLTEEDIIFNELINN